MLEERYHKEACIRVFTDKPATRAVLRGDVGGTYQFYSTKALRGNTNWPTIYKLQS
jgi:hypothetical protein